MTAADPFAHLAGLPGVAEAVDRARAAVDGLRGHRVLRRSAERVASESALRGARASAALEGVDRSLARQWLRVSRIGIAISEIGPAIV